MGILYIKDMSEHYITFSYEVLIDSINQFLILTKDHKQGSVLKMIQIILNINSKLKEIESNKEIDNSSEYKMSVIKFADECRDKIENIFSGRIPTPETTKLRGMAISITGQYQDIVKILYT